MDSERGKGDDCAVQQISVGSVQITLAKEMEGVFITVATGTLSRVFNTLF